MNKAIRALFADGTDEYRTPTEPAAGDTVRLRFRAAKDSVTEAFVCIGGESIGLSLEREKGCFVYYATEYVLGEAPVTYYFEVHLGEEIWYYDRRGAVRDRKEEYAFRMTPGFTMPDWAKGAVMYQIFTDRFCNGTVTNDVKDREYCYIEKPVQAVSDWDRPPQTMDVRDFYGGDLQGVWKKLDYLQELGVEVIYFNPLFVSPSNHKYDSQDYDYIDPHYAVLLRDEGECLSEGDRDNSHATKYISRVSMRENLDTSNAYFAALVQEIHRRGMRVILDGVFNHCGSFHKWLDRERIYENAPGYAKGAYVSENSPYRKFFEFTNEAWPYNSNYVGWWGHATLPKLNYEASEELCAYILNVAKKWIAPPYHVDGWRLDVAADLGHSEEFNHLFWQRFRKSVKEENPEALILAEHYGSARAWLNGNEWDSVMNYDAFMEPLTWFLTGMEKHSDAYRGDLVGNAEAFADAMTHHMAQFQTGSLQAAMNELSNHDHSRFLTRTNGKVGRLESLGSAAASEGVRRSLFMAAVAVQMTWVGSPTVYYGDEAGVCGFTDPDNRRTYPWGHEDKELIRLHKELIRIHRSYPALRTGSLKLLHLEQDVISYGRFNAQDSIIVAVNRGEQEKRVEIPVWETGILGNAPLVSLFSSGQEGFSCEAVITEAREGSLVVVLPPESSMIWKNLLPI
ncbi:MAG: glycoside hydrolase family 13 protein [Lachnospiraceae bacterium]